MKTSTAILFFLLVVGLAACGGSSNTVTSPPDPVLASVTLASATVTAGTTVQGTASLDRAAKSGGANVSLSSSNTSIATVPGSVLVPEGAQSASFTITGVAAGSVSITANFGGSRTATLNVTQARTTPVIAQFTEPDSTFMTSDIRDVDEQIVQFDTANNELIWKADDRSFPGIPSAACSSGRTMRSRSVSGWRMASAAPTSQKRDRQRSATSRSSTACSPSYRRTCRCRAEVDPMTFLHG